MFLWATSLMKGKGMVCRARSLRREGRMEPGEDKLKERSQELTRTGNAKEWELDGPRTDFFTPRGSLVFARVWGSFPSPMPHFLVPGTHAPGPRCKCQLKVSPSPAQAPILSPHPSSPTHTSAVGKMQSRQSPRLKRKAEPGNEGLPTEAADRGAFI